MEVIKNVFKSKKIIILSISIILVISLLLLNFTKSVELLENDTKVEKNSDLIYYLTVMYDGKDKNAHVSGIDADVKVYSGYIQVTDRIPEGLEFQEFITSVNGTVGAVNQKDTSKSCLGGVYNDTKASEETNTNDHGLHYDGTTRTVNFKIKGLQAGCQLTVGIKTKTPETIDDPTTTEIETRRDFYNEAYAKEKNLTKKSNRVHAFMEDTETTTHNVTYQYDSSAPENAPELPGIQVQAPNSKVAFATPPSVEGYRFTGWKITNPTSTIYTETNFVMPDSDVTVTGSFEKIESHTVTYEIESTEKPEGFTVSTRSYYSKDIVPLDTTKVGEIIDGYEFLGWNIDLELNEDKEFIMPDYDVVIKGNFKLKKYKVEYQFTEENGGVIPPGVSVPEPVYYQPNEKVKLPEFSDILGYHFRGWYEGDNFEMPEEDIVVLGEWEIQNGLFEPDIKIDIINKKSSYQVGDTINYKITVTNKETYPIKDVNIIENKKGKFIKDTGSNYALRTDRMVEIPVLNADSSVEILGEYTVQENDTDIVINEVELLSATADNNYNFNESKTYIDSITAKIAVPKQLKLCNVVNKEDTFQYHLTSTDNTFDTWLTLTGNACKTLILEDNTYQVTQVDLQDYELESVTGAITSNGGTFTLTNDITEITFNNKYRKKGFYHANGRVVNLVLGSGGNTSNVPFDISTAQPDSEIKFYQHSSYNNNGNGLFVFEGTESDEHPIYYYRGAVTNNNVLFANICWKIVRTTETGGTKLIYNGSPTSDNKCTNITGTATQINGTTYKWNNSYDNAKYVGYMYDNASSVAQHGTSESNAKVEVDKWYKTNIEDKGYTNYLEDAVWCNERTIGETLGSYIYYGAYTRLFTNKERPKVKDEEVCSNKEDRYTVRDTEKGNGYLQYPVGLLTMDEAELGGIGEYYASGNTFNTTSYLYTGQNFWLLSPNAFRGGAYVFLVVSSGSLSIGSTGIPGAYGLRPSISLRPGTTFTSGDGEPAKPYIVKEG